MLNIHRGKLDWKKMNMNLKLGEERNFTNPTYTYHTILVIENVNDLQILVMKLRSTVKNWIIT